MAGTWTASIETNLNVTPNVVNVTATYTDAADPTISFSWNCTAKVAQANLNTFVADCKARLAVYLTAHTIEQTRLAAIVAALNA